MFPSDDEHQQKVWQTWKGCQILAKGLLEEAHCLQSKDFVVIEDCSEDALPTTTTLTHNANAAEKCCQLGKDAAYSMLRGALGALGGSSGKPAVLVVDLFSHTGDVAKACMKERFNPAMSLNLRYLGLHSSQLEAMCFANQLGEWIAFWFSPLKSSKVWHLTPRYFVCSICTCFHEGC